MFLYDLGKGISETIEVSSRYVHVLKKLKADLESWQRDVAKSSVVTSSALAP